MFVSCILELVKNMPKAKVDLEKCIACGTCYSTYPELFEEGEGGHSHVKDPDFAKHGYKADEIVGCCPADAISVEE